MGITSNRPGKRVRGRVACGQGEPGGLQAAQPQHARHHALSRQAQGGRQLRGRQPPPRVCGPSRAPAPPQRAPRGITPPGTRPWYCSAVQVTHSTYYWQVLLAGIIIGGLLPSLVGHFSAGMTDDVPRAPAHPHPGPASWSSLRWYGHGVEGCRQGAAGVPPSAPSAWCLPPGSRAPGLGWAGHPGWAAWGTWGREGQ
jgi:hypothetical protein